MYRTSNNLCHYHIPWEEKFEKMGFNTSLYLPKCNICDRHVDIQGVIIGRQKMLAEMKARNEQ